MQIQVLGSGCKTCKNLFEITKKAVAELGIDSEVEYITDISRIIEMGIMTSPVLAIDGKAAMNGFSNDIEKIKDLILMNNHSGNDHEDKKEKSRDCNCGADCC